MYDIFTYIYHINQRKNVGEYTSPMDPMGNGVTTSISVGLFFPQLIGAIKNPMKVTYFKHSNGSPPCYDHVQWVHLPQISGWK